MNKRLIVPLLALAAVLLPSLGGEQPAPSAARTEADVRVLQAAVTVRGSDKSGKTLTGLTPWNFEIRLDGRRLRPGEEVSIDPVCAGTGAAPAAAGDQRPVLIFVDFNYLDAAGRQAVATAIEDLAERLVRHPEGDIPGLRYKVFAIARGVRELTDGLTRDPVMLRRVAAAIRSTHYRNGDDAGPDTGPGKLLTSIIDPNAPVENQGQDPELSNRADHSGFALRPETSSDATLFVRGKGGVTARPAKPSYDDSPKQKARRPMTLEDAGMLKMTARLRQQEAERDALASYDATASIEAIRAVLLAHADLPGRKAVVLYSSNAFDVARQERLQVAIESLQPLFNGLYVFWTADAAGLAPQSRTRSPLLSALAADSGGGSVRRSGGLGRAIESAEQSLACYYLLTVRLPATESNSREHRLDVGLDTQRFPELWGARVIEATGLDHLGRSPQRLEGLSAPLLAPDAFHEMELRATLDGPYWSDGDPFAVVQARLPLDQLEAGTTSRLRLEMVVTRDAAEYAAPLCHYATPLQQPVMVSGNLHPLRREHGEIVMDMPCPLPRSGSYTATVALTDLGTGRIAAARDRVRIELSALGAQSTRIARLATHSPADVVWNPSRRWATPYTSWPVWRLRDGDREIAREEEVVIRYLTCPDKEQKGWLLRWDEQGRPEVLPVEQVRHVALTVDAPLLAIPGCTTRAVAFPPFSLAAGDYRFVLADPEISAEQVLAAHATSGADEVTSPRTISFELRDRHP